MSRQQTTKYSPQPRFIVSNNGQPTATKSSPLNKAKQAQSSTISTATAANSKKSVNQSGKLVKLCKSCQDLDAGERELRECNDCAYASGNGKKRGHYLSDQQTPSKTARPTKAPGVWCDDCLKRKTEPGEEGRTRRNAKWACKDCAKLREEAGLSRGRRNAGLSPTPSRPGAPGPRQGRSKPRNLQPTPEPSQAAIRAAFSSQWEKQNNGESSQSSRRKGWMLAVPRKPQQQQTRGDELSTESDDPDNRPKPIVNNADVDSFRTPIDRSNSTSRWNEQPPHAAATLVPREMPISIGAQVTPSVPFGTVNPALIMKNPGEPEKPSLFEERTRAMWDLPPMDLTFSSAPNDGSIPQQQQPSDDPNALQASAPMPFQFNGLSGSPKESQDNDSLSILFPSSEQMGFEVSEMPGQFNQAMEDITLSNVYEASIASQSAGGTSDYITPEWDTGFSSTSQVLDPEPFSFWSMPGPVYSPLIDPSLSAAQAPAPAKSSAPAPAMDNNGEEKDISRPVN